MKKFILSLALLTAASGAFAQEDKAAAKAAAAALKAAQKEAKSQMTEAININNTLDEKLRDAENPMSEEDFWAQSKKGSALITAALASGNLAENKLADAYKASAAYAFRMHNMLIGHAAKKEPFDTALFLPNLVQMTDGLSNELKYTKVVKGETGNEKDLLQKKDFLSKSKDYYIYAAQFEADCKRYDNALKAYDLALNYVKNYPLVANIVKCSVEDNQIAYYAYFAAHDAKKFDMMDKYYDLAVTFAAGAEGVKQLVSHKYLEQGDTVKWAETLKKQVLAEPAANDDNIQRLLGYYMSKGTEAMTTFADEIIAVDPTSKIANYGKGYALFTAKKYDEALACYLKATESAPDYYDAWYQAGMCKYRQAIDLNSTIESIKNQVKAKEAKAQTQQLFTEAIPYFEKARECEPDSPNKWAFELKQCYSAAGNKAKADEMDQLL